MLTDGEGYDWVRGWGVIKVGEEGCMDWFGRCWIDGRREDR